MMAYRVTCNRQGCLYGPVVDSREYADGLAREHAHEADYEEVDG